MTYKITSRLLGLALLLFGAFILVSSMMNDATKSETATPLVKNERESESKQADNNKLESAKAVNQALFEKPIRQLQASFEEPKTLAGLDLTIDFKVSEKNNLVPTYAIREMFDFYLSAYGEAELEDIIGMIQVEISQSLDEPAKSEALSLLKRYIDYKIDLAEYQPELHQGDSSNAENDAYLEKLISAHRELQEKRGEYFDAAEYDSFFAREDAHNNYMIEQIRINTNANLSAHEKSQRLQQARSFLPQDVVETRQRVQRHADLRQQVSQLRGEGANSEEVFLLREKNLGTEAAQALAQLDEQRNRWSERLSEFSEERRNILDSSLSEQDKSTSVDTLIASHFEQSEHKRVYAIMNDGRLD